MNKGIWKSDWFTGLVITLVFLFLSTSGFIQSTSDFTQGVEQYAYDIGVKSSSSNASDKISIIAIDDESIGNIGRWPWSRNVHANLHTILSEGGAKVIGQTILFSEPELDAGSKFIKELKINFENSSLAAIPELITELNTVVAETKNGVKTIDGGKAVDKISSFLDQSLLNTAISDEINGFIQYIGDASIALDSDIKLAESMAISGNVVLAMNFQSGNPIGQPDNSQPEFILKNVIPKANVSDNPDGDIYARPIPMVDIYPPISILGKQSSGVGSLVLLPDVDGGIRSEPLVVDYYGDLYPSMALILAAQSLNLGVEDINVTNGESVQLGQLNIR